MHGGGKRELRDDALDGTPTASKSESSYLRLDESNVEIVPTHRPLLAARANGAGFSTPATDSSLSSSFMF